jgi:hypothetical protein
MARRKKAPAWRATAMALGLWLLIVGAALALGILDRQSIAFTGAQPYDLALPMLVLGALLLVLPLPIGLLVRPRAAAPKPSP